MTEDRGLDTLQVWQRSLEFASLVCRDILPQFPEKEKWALISQLRRAVQSVPANIAEGYGRFYYQESIRFCYIARGSLEETYSHLILARRLDYLNEETIKKLTNEIQEIRRMTNGYISFLKTNKRGQSEPGAALSVHEATILYDTDDPSES